jgi:hypothetical protein
MAVRYGHVTADVRGVEQMAKSERGLRPGDRVQVRTRYDGDWADGYEVADVAPDGTDPAIQVLRVSDRTVLPVAMPSSQVRPER